MARKAWIMGSITIILWASAFAAIRLSLKEGYEPTSLVLMRFLVASLFFLLFFLFSKKQFQLPERKDLSKIFVLGFLGITVYHVGITFGMETVEAGTASMIVGSSPFFTSIIAALFLKERIDLLGWIGLTVGFFGIVLITLGTSEAVFSISIGAIYVIIATISTSIFFVFQKTLNRRYHPVELTAYFTWAGTIPMVIFLPDLFQSWGNATIQAHVTAIYVGVFPAALAYATWAIALSLAEASKVTMLMYLEPVLAILIAWIWIHEWPSTLSFIGGAIAISSILLVNFFGKKRKSV